MEGGKFLKGDYSDTERQNGCNPTHPRKYRQFLKGPAGFSQGLPIAQVQSVIGRSKPDGLTLNREWRSLSTGTSLSWPFFARLIAVRLAKVMTTSSGRFSRISDRPLGGVRVMVA